MTTDRRLTTAVNAVLAGLVLSAVGALVWTAHQAKQAETSPLLDGVHRSYFAAVRAAHQAERSGQIQEAEADYLQALGLRPKSRGIRLEIATFYADHGMGEKALTQFRPIVEPLLKEHRLPYELGASFVRYGDLLLTRGDPAGAREAYAAVTNGQAPRSLANARSQAYLRAAPTNASGLDRFYRKGIELDPGNWRTYGLEQVRMWWAAHPPDSVRYESGSQGTPLGLDDHDLERIARLPAAVSYLRRLAATLRGVERTALLRAIAEFEQTAKR